MVGQRVSNNTQQAFPVHNGYGQFIHMFQPSSLSSPQLKLHQDIHPRFMISTNCHRYTINVTMPFKTHLIYSQQFFFSPAIVAFRRSILATMVSKWMQTIIILLQQYSPGCITIYISVNNKQLSKVRQVQNRRVTQQFTKLRKCVVLVNTPLPRLLGTCKVHQRCISVSIMMNILRIVICQAKKFARLRLAWARGPAHVAHARGQYRHLSAVHTASALVSGLSSTWYHEFR